ECAYVWHILPMFGRSEFATFLWLVAIALLPVRVVDAHWHMCLEGQQTVVAFHVNDVPSHEGEDLHGSGHNDTDVEASDAAALNKIADLHGGGFLPSIYVLAILLRVPLSEAPRAAPPILDVDSPFDLRPPSRGPPA